MLRRGAGPAGGSGKHPSCGRAWPEPSRSRVWPTAMLDEDEDERVDEAALRQLTEMGFPETRAAKALRLNQYVWAPAAGNTFPARAPWPSCLQCECR